MFKKPYTQKLIINHTIPTGSTCQNSRREAQPRTNRGYLY
jgi:hypothetical protein